MCISSSLYACYILYYSCLEMPKFTDPCMPQAYDLALDTVSLSSHIFRNVISNSAITSGNQPSLRLTNHNVPPITSLSISPPIPIASQQQCSQLSEQSSGHQPGLSNPNWLPSQCRSPDKQSGSHLPVNHPFLCL